ncbi:MAG: FAD-binding protein [Saprospiraceae bacterium]|nr:FAD-binding protein [Saprospiraceae bacterium]
MAKTVETKIGTWDTFHNNGPFPLKLHLRTHLEEAHLIPSIIERYKDAAAEIRLLIKNAMDAGEGLRAYGSRWSMSSVAHHHDRVLDNTRMNLKMTIKDFELHPNSAFKSENLFLFQCGNVIQEISEFLFNQGKSLKSSGASNGQTIAGCISTGVHGAAVFAGAVQDYVVGINLITGPNPEDIIYLERQDRPAVSDDFIKTLGVASEKIHRDDELFNAALVGLGAFGFIHGVVIEAENLFLLQRYTKLIPKKEVKELIDAFDFKDFKKYFPAEVDDQGNSLPPYHFKVFVNPYDKGKHYMIEAMYKKPYVPGYPDPVKNIESFLYRDLIIFLAKFVRKFPRSIPKLITLLQSKALPPEELNIIGTLKEIFWTAPHHGPVFAVAMAVDVKDANQTMDLLNDLVKNNPVPGVYAMRFTKGTSATLGFTRFEKTCIIEMDGVQWKGSRKLIAPEIFYTRIIQSLKAAGIEFTHHWGKNARWNFPDLLEYMYGEERIKQWKVNRGKLLTPSMAKIFSNQFLDVLNLSDVDGGDEV